MSRIVAPGGDGAPPGGALETPDTLWGMPNIVMYTSAVCPFCIRAKRLLDAKGVAYEERMLDLSPESRQMLVDLTGRYTVPQILIDDTPVGGFDEISALDRAGELDGLLGLA
jgi:glutaredoxin 3